MLIENRKHAQEIVHFYKQVFFISSLFGLHFECTEDNIRKPNNVPRNRQFVLFNTYFFFTYIYRNGNTIIG